MLKTEFNSKLISLEGNIGSGKSSLLNLIQQSIKDCSTLLEPVNDWQHINNNPNLNLLDNFYQDPKKWAFTFQQYAYYSRMKQIKQFQQLKQMEQQVQEQQDSDKMIPENDQSQNNNQTDDSNKENIVQIEQNNQQKHPQNQNNNSIKKYKNQQQLIVCERSVYSDRLFAINAYKSNLLCEIEWQLYQENFEWMVGMANLGLSGVIYLKTDAQNCWDRIQKRGRSEEKSSISINYLQSLEDRHQEWLCGDQELNIPVLIIDGNHNFYNDENLKQETIDKIKNFIMKIKMNSK